MERTHIFLIALCMVVSACCEDQPADDPTQPPKAQTEAKNTGDDVANALAVIPTQSKFSARDKAQADSLARRVTPKGELPWKVRGKPKRARQYLYLAATHPDARIRAAALGAMPNAFTGNENDTKRALIDSDFNVVITTLLKSDDDLLLARALEASVPALQGGDADKELVQQIAKLAAEHPKASGRMAALAALRHLSGAHRYPEVNAALLAGVSDKDVLVIASAIDASSHNDPALSERIRALLTHTDPQVRGRATLKHARFVAAGRDTQQVEATVPVVLAMTKDKSAFVRSEAADALVALGNLPSIHTLMDMIDDDSNNTIQTSFVDLGGVKRTFRSRASGWSRVDDACIWAIAHLSRSMERGEPFKVPKVRFNHIEEDLKSAKAQLRIWYAAHKRRF